MNQYGIDINTLDKFITNPNPKNEDWGSKLVAVSVPEFQLERIALKKDKNYLLRTDDKREATIFLESGSVLTHKILLGVFDVIALPPGTKESILANNDSILYIFFGSPDHSLATQYFIKRRPFDYREKYWGEIQTIVSGEYAGKRIYVRKGQCSSLEFHCRKIESYFIYSGKLLVRLRAGRGEDRFFTLTAGMTLFTPPGLMHQRGGLEDTVIIEISTKDEDSDSFLVEDGQKHKMPNLLDK